MEWISALDAVHLISSDVGGDKKAKKLIAERLSDGAIRAKAWWSAQGLDIGKPYVEPIYTAEWKEGQPQPKIDHRKWLEWRMTATKPQVSDRNIGDGIALRVSDTPNLAHGFWRGATKEDRKRWDWATGFFLITIRSPTQHDKKLSSLPTRLFALGVSFERSDITRIVAQQENNSAQKRTNKGRPPSPKWAPWVAELIALNEETNITTLNTTKLIEAIADRMSEKGINEMPISSAHAMATSIQKALKEMS